MSAESREMSDLPPICYGCEHCGCNPNDPADWCEVCDLCDACECPPGLIDYHCPEHGGQP